MDIAQEMLTTFNDVSDLLQEVITGNESWMYGYDIETKAKLHQASRSVRKSQDRKNYVKFVQMSNGVVHQQFLLRSRTVKYYSEVMLRLRELSR